MLLTWVSSESNQLKFTIIISSEEYKAGHGDAFHTAFKAKSMTLEHELNVTNNMAGKVGKEIITYHYTVKPPKKEKFNIHRFLHASAICFKTAGIDDLTWNQFFKLATGHPYVMPTLPADIWQEIAFFAGVTARSRLLGVSKGIKEAVYDPARDLKVHFPKDYDEVQKEVSTFTTPANQGVISASVVTQEVKREDFSVSLSSSASSSFGMSADNQKLPYKAKYKLAHKNLDAHLTKRFPNDRDRERAMRLFVYVKEGDIAAVKKEVDKLAGQDEKELRWDLGTYDGEKFLLQLAHEKWLETKNTHYKEILDYYYNSCLNLFRIENTLNYNLVVHKRSVLHYAVECFQDKETVDLLVQEVDSLMKESCVPLVLRCVELNNVVAAESILNGFRLRFSDVDAETKIKFITAECNGYSAMDYAFNRRRLILIELLIKYFEQLLPNAARAQKIKFFKIKSGSLGGSRDNYFSIIKIIALSFVRLIPDATFQEKLTLIGDCSTEHDYFSWMHHGIRVKDLVGIQCVVDLNKQLFTDPKEQLILLKAVMSIDGSDMCLFYISCLYGKSERINCLLAQFKKIFPNPTFDQVFDFLSTALFAACENNRPRIIKTVVQTFISLMPSATVEQRIKFMSAINKDGVSTVSIGCEKGHKKVIACLTEQFAQLIPEASDVQRLAFLSAVRSDGASSFYVASKNGHGEVAETLMAQFQLAEDRMVYKKEKRKKKIKKIKKMKKMKK